MAYIPLQVKSGYSLMNSTITIPKLIKQAKELKLDALALADEQVLYGAIPFYKACMAAGIKPVIGMSTAVILEDEYRADCVLLAKNNEGYHSLIHITTAIQQKQAPGISLEELKQHATGLICLLPASDPALARLLLTETHDQTAAYLHKWTSAFAEGNFYLGVSQDEQEQTQRLHYSLKAFQENYQIPAAAVQEVRYLDEKDKEAYSWLQAMKQGSRDVKDEALQRPDYHLRSPGEMERQFSFWTEVLSETESIRDKCNVEFQFDQRMLPSFPVPEAISAHDYLEKRCRELVKTKYREITDTIAERLDYELHVIQSMQFSAYFLIVADFIDYAKANNILVGPGRGSAAGSLVAYVLGITDVDPLKYDLLFERFLNPERLTMPDIDIDFSDARRDEVIEYVREKYGKEHVAQIITFGTFAARSLIRELSKMMEIDQRDVNFIIRQIPPQSGKSIGQIVRQSKDLTEYIKQSDKLKGLFSVAARLEGIPRHISTHAAGVVISEQPLTEVVPLTVGANQTSLTQYPMNELEEIGLLKMDFLGLRNLTLMENILKSINFSGREQLELTDIPENDSDTFALLQTGKTNGIFQLESQGMKQVLTGLKPTSFEDIIAVNALYRPGPMEFIPTYIQRKFGKEKVTYPHPDLEPILARTYGVLVYQEQIMQIAHQIAGFSLGQADILRRATSKKKQAEMDEQKEAFIQGCRENGYREAVAEEIFDWIVRFSNYGFNRSHAVAYSMISYQLSYLKAHYPANFFAALMSSIANQQEKVAAYIKEIKEMDIPLRSPSINKSFGRFSVEGSTIRMGLLAIKGIGGQVIREIIRVRKNGPFKDLFDFCLRVPLSVVNRSSLETLIMAGTFDEVYSNRASLLASVDGAIEQGELFREFNEQSSLFQEQIDLEASYVEMEDLGLMRKLADEKELLGVYISSHPLKEMRRRLRENGLITLTEAAKLVGKRHVKSAAVIQTIKTIRTKRGDAMAFLTIGDETGEMEAVMFPELYRETNRWLEEEMLVLVSGKIESRNGKVQWQLATIQPLEENSLEKEPQPRLFIRLSNESHEDALEELKGIAAAHPGSTPVIIFDQETKKAYKLANNYFVEPNHACMQSLKSYFEKENVVLQK
ncbi:DNA polymerase III subunit alpha [Lentibacillus sediminis]|uniref:DNA polymerase III subunit alpha n=1 Tax=Lentibacillus sediminis TaxID=1940529 RepID=UPI000C1BD785|nr:DNA polymerase III subunit alpha [Lentibacillus sediminis]